MIRALVDRAAAMDTEALEQLAALEQLISQATTRAGWELHTGGDRAAEGYSHSQIAAVLGISRQASVKRFGAESITAPVRLFLMRHNSAAQLMGMLVTRNAARRSA